jgi:tetratricopeptide (TPR) repeat protein
MTSLNVYRTEILKEAEAICRGDRPRDPDQPHVLHLRGLLAAQDSQREFASACLMRAAVLDSRNPAYFADLGEVLSERGRPTEALGGYLRAIMLAPTDPGPYQGLGKTLIRHGRSSEATAMYREALRLDPTEAHTHCELGYALCARGRLRESIECYETALRLDPNNVKALYRLGDTHLHLREWKQALTRFRQGLQLEPRCVDLHVGVGAVLLHCGSIEEAVAAFRDALAINARHVSACRHLACALELLGRRDDAVGAWCGLGEALESVQLFNEAAAAYDMAIVRKPDCLRALFRRGQVHMELAQPRSAIRCFERALEIDGGHRDAHVGIACACQLLGDAGRGWREFAYYTNSGYLRDFEQPLWNGSPIEGRTVLLWADQGLGDAIQHLRYVRHVEECGARVLLQCDPRLLPLVERLPCVHGVFANGTPLPSFDTHAPLFSLPRIMQRRGLTINVDVPYLMIDCHLTDKWRQRLGKKRERAIGIVWGSAASWPGARFKCLPLAMLAPLAQLPGLRVISLQLGSQVAELLAPPPGLEVEQFLDEASTIADTAALILNLDLVITVDTMVAHLAGALAKPVWTLVRHAAEWRWLLEGDTTPWYPTMRLFRQRRAGIWPDVVEQVRAALETGECVAGKDGWR